MSKMKNILEIIIILLLVSVLIKLNFAQDSNNRYEIIKSSDLSDIILLDKKTGLTWRTDSDDSYMLVNIKYIIPPTNKIQYNKKDFASRIKHLFPEYKKMDNEELVRRFIITYPEYKKCFSK